jgi:hypothetical protein
METATVDVNSTWGVEVSLPCAQNYVVISGGYKKAAASDLVSMTASHIADLENGTGTDPGTWYFKFTRPNNKPNVTITAWAYCVEIPQS